MKEPAAVCLVQGGAVDARESEMACPVESFHSTLPLLRVNNYVCHHARGVLQN